MQHSMFAGLFLVLVVLCTPAAYGFVVSFGMQTDALSVVTDPKAEMWARFYPNFATYVAATPTPVISGTAPTRYLAVASPGFLQINITATHPFKVAKFYTRCGSASGTSPEYRNFILSSSSNNYIPVAGSPVNCMDSSPTPPIISMLSPNWYTGADKTNMTVRIDLSTDSTPRQLRFMYLHFEIPDYCDTPTEPNGQFARTHVPDGMTTALSCDSGYTPNRADALCNNGTFAAAVPVCIVSTCPSEPGSVNNGGYTGSCAGFNSGQTCPYSCTTGYESTDPAPTCTSGSWSSAPSCTAKSCTGQPLGVTGGSYAACSTTAHNSACSFSCNLGWSLAGSPPLCNLGNWNPPTQTCTALPCDTSAVVRNSTLIGTCQGIKTDDAACAVACETPRFFPSGGLPAATCVGTGLNTNRFTTTLQCSASPCTSTPPVVTSGSYPVCTGSSYPNNTVCSYNCDSGYGKSAGTSAVCAYGVWIAGSATCTPSACTGVPSTFLPGILATGCSGMLTGESCTLNCNGPNYEYVSGTQGSTAGTCPSGTFQTNLVCRAKGCSGAPLTPLNNGVYGSCSSVTHGGICGASCNDGYFLNVNAVCNFGSYNSTANCQASSCGTLSLVGGGRVSTACNAVTTGGTCTLTCNPANYFRPLASSNGDVLCQANVGQSTSSYRPADINAFFCTPNACTGPPPAVGFGAYTSCTGSIDSGVTCPFSCNPGYTRSGLPHSCWGGSWNTTAVSCSPASCTPFTTPNTNHNCVGPQTTTQTCAMTCNSGYSRVQMGSASVTFTCTGSTAGVPGTPGTSAYVITTGGGTAFTCSPDPCNSNPNPVTNGFYPSNCFGTPSGNTCAFTCNPGYTASANSVACTTGNWGSLPTCNPGSCGSTDLTNALAAVTGMAQGTCNNIAVGGTCAFACQNGYAIQGSTAANCIARGGNNLGLGQYTTTLTCALVPCATSTLSLPLSVVRGTCTREDLTITSAPNTCTLACRDGYSQSGGSPTATCSGTPGSSAYTWTFSCAPNQCSGGPLTPVSGFQQTNGDCATNLVTDQLCTLGCNTGYGPVDDTTATVRCVGNAGQSTSAYQRNLTCGVIPCILKTLGPQVKVGNCTAPQQIGQSCNLGCNDGYFVGAGNPLARCVSLGAGLMDYSFHIRCNASACPAYPISGGLVRGNCPSTATNRTGDSCTLRCADGYAEVAGTDFTASCEPVVGSASAAYVTSPAPQCTYLTCAAPTPAQAHQHIGDCPNNVDHITDTCTMKCDDGYAVQGNPTATCSRTAYGAVGYTFSYNCIAATCVIPSMASIGQGVIPGSCTASLTTGGTCNLACATGFQLGGGAQANCVANAGMSTSSFVKTVTCTPYLCAVPNPLPRGQSAGTCNSTSIINQSCRWACKDGYYRAGNLASTNALCVDDAGTAVKYTNNIVCTPSVCARPSVYTSPLILNGTCTANHTTDETCALACKPGYKNTAATSYTASCLGQNGRNSSVFTYSLACEDVDECASNTDNCHGNANCFNTIGSFYCTCKPNFVDADGVQDNGVQCIDAPSDILATVLSFDMWVPTEKTTTPTALSMFGSSLPFVLISTLLSNHGIEAGKVHMSSVSVSGDKAPPANLPCTVTTVDHTLVKFQVAVAMTLGDWSWYTAAVNQWATCGYATELAKWTHDAILAQASATTVTPESTLTLCSDGSFQGSCPSGESGGSSAAVVAAVVIILLVLIGAAVGYWYWRKRRGHSRHIAGVGSELALTHSSTASTLEDEEAPRKPTPSAPAAAAARPASGSTAGPPSPARAGSAAPSLPARQGTANNLVAKGSNAPSPTAKGSVAAGAAGKTPQRDWSSLALLLADPIGLAAFQVYLKKELSAENLDFWMAVEEYRKTKQELCKTMSPTEKPLRQAMKPHATKIFTRYLAQTVDSAQVNVPEDVDARTKNRLRQHFDLGVDQEYGDPSKTLFDEAEDVIFKLMESDSFGRFQKTPEFARARASAAK